MFKPVSFIAGIMNDQKKVRIPLVDHQVTKLKFCYQLWPGLELDLVIGRKKMKLYMTSCLIFQPKYDNPCSKVIHVRNIPSEISETEVGGITTTSHISLLFSFIQSPMRCVYTNSNEYLLLVYTTPVNSAFRAI